MKHQDFTNTLKESLGGRSRTDITPRPRTIENEKVTANIGKESTADNIKESDNKPVSEKSSNDVSTDETLSNIESTKDNVMADTADKSLEVSLNKIPDIMNLVVEDDDSAVRKLERKKPGRKKMDASKKKVQITLTVKHDTLDELMKVRGYKQKLSWYFDDNVEMLKEAIKKL